MEQARKIKISASIICSDFLRLLPQVRQLEKSKVDSLEIDVMDGAFVPRIGLPPEFVKHLRSITALPIDVHMMIDNPETKIKPYIDAGASTIIVHAESTRHLSRAINIIKDLGASAGVALNPATPSSVLDYIVDDIVRVMVMGINPGILGHKLLPATYRRISDLREKLGDQIIIEVDGGVTNESILKMISSGADMFVCGSSTIFSSANISGNIKKLRRFASFTNE